MEARDATAATGGRLDPSRPLVAARPRYGEYVIKGLLAACAVISVATTTIILISLLTPTIGFFEEVSFSEFFSTDTWAPLTADPSFGVLRVVVGTLSTTLWGLLFAIPVGLLSAIYLSEYAPPRVRKVVKPILEILAGIPTVAFGVFFTCAVQIALPLVAVLFIADLGLSLLTKVAPQLNAIGIMFPAKIGLTLLVVGMSFPVLPHAIDRLVDAANDAMAVIG